jgi:Family of unknown function (DUF6788)
MLNDNAKAIARRQALIRSLPDPEEILRASLITRFTRCGKPGCKCMRGEKHGPSYLLSVTVAQGKTKQMYVRQQDVQQVKRLIDNYDKFWTTLVEISNINFELLRPQPTAPTARTRPRRSGKRQA